VFEYQALAKYGPPISAVMNLLRHLDRVRLTTAAGAHLHQLAVLLLHCHQQRALGRVVAARLFHVHMLACLHARQSPSEHASGRASQS
jgi:hypothetical protein